MDNKVIDIENSKTKEKDYINILFDRFDYKLDNDKLELLRKKTLSYIDKKLAYHR